MPTLLFVTKMASGQSDRLQDIQTNKQFTKKVSMALTLTNICVINLETIKNVLQILQKLFQLYIKSV